MSERDLDSSPVPDGDPEVREPDRSSFGAAFNEFVATTWALLDLADVVAPAAEQLDVPKWILVLEDIAGEFPDADTRRQFRNALQEGWDKVRSGELTRAELETAPPRATDDDAPSGRRVRRTHVEALAEAFMQEQRDVQQGIRPARRVLLMRSLLTTLISNLEVLIGNLVASYYRAHPDAIGDTEREFSLADLKRFNDISDAIDDAIGTRVDQFLLEGSSAWRKWFARTSKTDFGELTDDLDGLLEIFQRRHMIVHNNGRVSRRYLANVAPRFRDVEVGAELPVDEQYFRGALTQVLVFGSLLGACVWSHVVPKERETASERLQALTEKAMEAGHWHVVELTTQVATVNIASSEASRVVFRFNNWLARKRQYELDSVRAEIEEFDDSALSGVFAFVRLALLDRHEDAIDYVDHLLESHQVSYRNLRDWPVLAELRELPEFKRRLTKLRAAERRKVSQKIAARTRRIAAGTTPGADPATPSALAKPLAAPRIRKQSAREKGQ